MKKIITLLFVIIVTVTLTAQKDSAQRMKRKHKWDIPQEELPVLPMPRIIFKLAPVSMLNGYDGPSARAGIEYKLKDNFNLYNELGYFFYNTGVITKIELKKYITNMYAESCIKSSRDYISFEFVFKRQEYGAGDSIFKSAGSYYYKDFNVRKSVECLNVKFGTLMVYKSGLTIDLFAGAGIRLRQGCNNLSKDENIKSSSDYGPNVFTNYAGRMIFPNVDIGVKIGFGMK
jgi:hypothetical protein